MPAAATTAATTASKVASTTVERAVTALLKWKEAQSETQNPKLIPDDDFIYLIITLKKIPPKSRTNPFKIPLPHPLHTPPSSELCLIIDDRPNSKPNKKAVKKLVNEQSIPIAKVMTLSKLKADYKPFEAKRKLCDSYDLFLVDKRVVHFLPKLLGKEFFKKRKLPVGVDLGKKDWRGQVEKACRSGLMYLRTGTCCVVKVGKLAMGKEEIVENVVEGIEGAVGIVPKNWGGVRSLHLKLADSVALPLYQALPDVKLKIEGAKKEGKDVSGSVVEAKAESTDDEGLKAKEGKKKKKGRIHEVRYMDVALVGEELVNEEDEDDMVKSEESAGEELEDDKDVGNKRKKGGLVKGFENEQSDEESEENDDFGSDDLGSKKRKKTKSEKLAKKGRKVGKTDVLKEKKERSSQKGKGKRKSDIVGKSNEGSSKTKDKRSKKRVAAA